jgi:hypothetical protein
MKIQEIIDTLSMQGHNMKTVVEPSGERKIACVNGCRKCVGENVFEEMTAIYGPEAVVAIIAEFGRCEIPVFEEKKHE